MKIQLSDHFTYKRLMRFTLPSIVMMIFTSIYGVVDGLFVSNFVGKTPFAAVNFIYPLIMILGTFGFMFGAGGSALIGKTLGEGKREKASELFTMFIAITVGAAVVLGTLAIFFMPRIAVLMGAKGAMLHDCVVYARISCVALPFLMLQYEFQSFFITAEKPQLGLTVTVISGVTNMVLDGLFMAVFRWGVAGAAAATGISQAVAGIIGLAYFARPGRSLLHLTRFRFDAKALLKACGNGSSELMSNVSMSLVSMLYNIQLIKYAGEDGVAAYGVLMYVNFIFLSVLVGYSTGIAPVISYHFGAEDHPELRNLLKKSLIIIGVMSAAMVVAAEALASPLSRLFVGYDDGLFTMTERAFRIYSFSFLFAGYAIFGSGFFTALNDGVTSAVMSFLRTVVFQVAAVLLLPLVWGIDGIWASIVAAELVAASVSGLFIVTKRPKFHY